MLYTSTLIQIEGTLQNEFYPQLAAIKGFLAWKEEGNIRTREVQLTEQKHQQLVQYHKTEIEVYQQKIWTDRIQNRIQIRPKSLEMDETLMNIIRRMHKKEILLNKHNYLFNYSTTKMEDSFIMDYIHGNSLLFGTVRRKLDEREDGKCYFCNTLAVDDPAHQMLECEEVKDVTYNDLKHHIIDINTLVQDVIVPNSKIVQSSYINRVKFLKGQHESLDEEELDDAPAI